MRSARWSAGARDAKLPDVTTTAPDHTTDDATRASRTHLAQRALGFHTARGPGFRIVRNATTPLIYDANYVDQVEAGAADEPGRFFEALDAAHAGLKHRKVVCDPRTPPVVEALLAAHGFEAETLVQMVLPGAWPARSLRRVAGLSIEPVESEADWAELVELQHLNFGERCGQRGVPPFERAVAEQMVASWRAKPQMTFWLARQGVEPCAYVGSWPGLEIGDGPRLGMVESLFTLPWQRHRGIATSLIARGVEHVRARGAGPVLIGADILDTPKQMYLNLGFRPVCLTREWLCLPAER